VAGADHQRVPFLLLQCGRGIGCRAKAPSPHYGVFFLKIKKVSVWLVSVGDS
jgi:hypothetical protein